MRPAFFLLSIAFTSCLFPVSFIVAKVAEVMWVLVYCTANNPQAAAALLQASPQGGVAPVAGAGAAGGKFCRKAVNLTKLRGVCTRTKSHFSSFWEAQSSWLAVPE